METISPEYARLNQQLHEQRKDYGCKSSRHIARVKTIAALVNAESILDYGCGKGDLVRALSKSDYDVQGFDPGHPDYTQTPGPADLVVCTDVMEHIEPDRVDAVIADIMRLANKAAFFLIALRYDSSKLLPDGTNPHKVVEPLHWWISKFKTDPVRVIDHTPGKQAQFVVLKNAKTD